MSSQTVLAQVCLRDAYVGVRGFYHGLSTAVVRGVVLNTFVFPVYACVVQGAA
jgi:hypothetical protein|eukprot:COSAG01_NODE_8402_length_2796_cov_5.331850_3_plen_53_part_00